jgi:hypothetical protein
MAAVRAALLICLVASLVAAGATATNTTVTTTPRPWTTAATPAATPATPTTSSAAAATPGPARGAAAAAGLHEEALQSQALHRILLSNGYSPSVPPFKVAVQNEMYLEQLVEVSTPQQTFTIQYWSRTYWKDDRLRWNATEWPAVTKLSFSEGEVWQPDEYIYDTIQLRQTPSPIKVSADGSVERSQHRVSTLACPMAIARFPFDKQVCKIVVGSNGYTQVSM